MAAITNKTALTASNVATRVYGPVPAGRSLTASISVCTRGAGKVSIAIGTDAVPADSDWIEYETPSAPGNPVVRTGEVLKAGEYITVT